jgi:hypothetical protein
MGSNSSKSSSRTIYGNTTTSNPYAYSKTDNNGTLAGFKNGTALQSVYDIVNKSVDSLLNEYINPDPNSPINQSKIKSFSNTLAQQTRNSLENDIINPLSKRNMLRSSQAADLYRNLLNQNVASVANYTNELYTNSSDEVGKKLSNLLSLYMLGANYLSDLQNHSLKASSGNASKYNSTSRDSDIASALLPYAISVMSSL